MPCCSQRSGGPLVLEISKAPSHGEITTDYQHSKRAVRRDEEGRDLAFSPTDDASDVDQYLRSLFPIPFDYLDKNHPQDIGSMHWVLLIKSNRNLSLEDLNKPLATGCDFLAARTPKGKPWTEQKIFVGWSPNALLCLCCQ